MRPTANTRLALLTAVVITMCSCLNKAATNYDTSDVCTIASFSLTTPLADSKTAVAAATFSIDNDSTPGLIINLDSLPYGTRIDSCIPAIIFTKAIAAAVIYNQQGDSAFLTGNDTIDFSTTRRIRVIASDMAHHRDYDVRVLVHAVEPDLYTWEQTATDVYTHPADAQRAFRMDDKICWLVNSPTGQHLYESADGRRWTDRTAELTGLTGQLTFADLTTLNNEAYFSDNDRLYHSADGISWTATDATTLIDGYRMERLLFVLNDALWATFSKDGQRTTASSADGQTWTLRHALPTPFPTNGFTAVTFQSPTRQDQALIIGGISPDGTTLNTRWLTADGQTWINLSSEQTGFGARSGAAAICYDNRLLLIGGNDADNAPVGQPLLCSQDAGLTWYVPDSAHNCMPDNFKARTDASTLLSASGHSFYIIGGQAADGICSDAWAVRLNSIGW
ncbi:MAG: hypothetical protein IJ680_05540 [Paludibacteraceae bacterium]|nr:hypothetical protein [Paludibacteraceae bacterium]